MTDSPIEGKSRVGLLFLSDLTSALVHMDLLTCFVILFSSCIWDQLIFGGGREEGVYLGKCSPGAKRLQLEAKNTNLPRPATFRTVPYLKYFCSISKLNCEC